MEKTRFTFGEPRKFGITAADETRRTKDTKEKGAKAACHVFPGSKEKGKR